MLRARIEPKFDTVAARLLVTFLAFAQPLVRGWSRYFTWLHFKRTPRGVISTHEKLPAGAEFTRGLRNRSYWSEEGKDRHHLLGSMFGLLDEEGWRYSSDTGWNEWDIQIYGNFWWSITLQTVTEYHGGPKCLTRAGLHYRFVPTTILINLVTLCLLVYHQLHAGHLDLWLLGLYFLFVLFLANRARFLKSRVAELVDLAAFRAGLQRIPRPTARAKVETAKVEATVEAS
jgi:O-antigen biosynthesis protein